MSTINCAVVLVRSEKYQKDYECYERSKRNENDYAFGGKLSFGAKLSEAGKTLCKKWDILYPVNPYNEVTDKKIMNWLMFVVKPSITYLDPPENWREWESIAWDNLGHKSGTEDMSELAISRVNGKLVLMVDTSRAKSALLREFEIFIDYWSTAQKAKSRRTMVDKWEVFDDYTYCGKNLSKIARKIYNLEKAPSIYNDTMKYYHRIRRPYKKASEMIQFIEGQAESKSIK